MSKFGPGGARDEVLLDLLIGGGGGGDRVGDLAGLTSTFSVVAGVDGRAGVEGRTVCRLETGGGGAIFFSTSDAPGGGGGGSGLSASLTEGDRFLVGDDGVACTGELDVDSDDLPLDRVRGLGGGGLIRVDEDLESVLETAGIDSIIIFAGSLWGICGEAVSASAGLVPSMIGSETDRRLTDAKFELLLLSVSIIGGCCCCCWAWPVNINCLNVSASRDCRLLPVAANGLLTGPPPVNVDMANDSLVSPDDFARRRNGFGDAEALLMAFPADGTTSSISDVSSSSALNGSSSAVSWSMF
jgi:hypothetical protein